MWNIIILGILLNVAVYAFSRGSYTKGIDSMPIFPIIAGYLYGSSAGLWAGIIIAATYHIVRIRTVHYAPLTIATNALAGFLAAYLAGLGIFPAGIILLVVYHVISGLAVSFFGGIKPGYFAFVVVNTVFSIAILYVSSFVL